MGLFTTVPHPDGHWQLQELLGNLVLNLTVSNTSDNLLLGFPCHQLVEDAMNRPWCFGFTQDVVLNFAISAHAFKDKRHVFGMLSS